MMAVVFVIVATLAAVATMSASRTVSGIADKVVNGRLSSADRLVLRLAAGIELHVRPAKDPQFHTVAIALSSAPAVGTKMD
jgi:hypothetical protein